MRSHDFISPREGGFDALSMMRQHLDCGALAPLFACLYQVKSADESAHSKRFAPYSVRESKLRASAWSVMLQRRFGNRHSRRMRRSTGTHC
jgi:hypothetical protein